MLRIRSPLFLALAFALSSACTESGADVAERSSAAKATRAPSPRAAAPAEPVPTPVLPVPTLAALFVGDPALRLLASGIGRPAPPLPRPALASAAAASPAPSPSGAAGAEGVLDESLPPEPPARALVAAAAISREPHERPDDETWSLPESPAEIIWRHPAPAAGLQVELLEAKGRSWPTRVRVEPAGAFRVATVTPLEALPPGKGFRLVARVLAADGRSLLWTEPLQVRRPEPPAETVP